MATVPLWFVNNRNPSITQQITIDKVPVDLTTSSGVTFSMRALNSSVMKVNAAAATIVGSPTNGNVRYDWAAADLDTPGFYLVTWQNTVSGKTQDVSEAIIEVRAHAPDTHPAYIEPEELKITLELTGTQYADMDVRRAVLAASRGIERCLGGRRFYLDADASQVRYYTPDALSRLAIDDLVTLTSVLIDRAGTGSFTETWVNGTDFVLEPLNAVADFRPFEQIRLRRNVGRTFPFWVEKSVQVTGKFGWPSIPEDIRQATSILAGKLLKRNREAPFGIVSLGLDAAATARIAREDPDVATLIGAYDRTVPFVP